MQPATQLSQIDVQRFRRHGFVVVNSLVPPHQVDVLRASAEAQLEPLIGPAEYEVDVHYPGAPANREAPGGSTPRRLLHALARDSAFRELATGPQLGGLLDNLLTSPVVSQCHHNCVMTKSPGFSSSTSWHQDMRYWSFDRPELVSAWISLGDERTANGGLSLIPGSHAAEIDRGRLDADLFLRTDLPQNQALIASAVDLELTAGDVLLFDCKLFHAAGMNRTKQVKLSLVFTYHDADNRPIPGTRSASYPSLPVATRGTD